MINSYNVAFSKYIIYDCLCYDQYKNFTKSILTERGNYMCCLVLPMNKQSLQNEYEIQHTILPIMIGSQIDLHIRRSSSGKDDYNLFGIFIIDGIHRYIPNFITNNLRYGHTYIQKGAKKAVKRKADSISETDEVTKTTNQIKCYIHDLYLQSSLNLLSNANVSASSKSKINKVTLKIKFHQSDDFERPDFHCKLQEFSIFLTPKIDYLDNRTKSSEMTKTIKKKEEEQINLELRGTTWTDLLAKNTKLSKYTKLFNYQVSCMIDDNQYLDYIRISLKYGPELDCLANKTILTNVEILKRVVEKSLEIDSADNPMKKLRNILLSGNFYWVLSNRFTLKLKNEFNSNYNMIDGQKLHLASYMTTLVRRYVNNCTRNSAALLFPKDGKDYICPINTKEMTSAGETISLSQFVIVSPQVDDSKVIEFLKSYNVYYNIPEEEWKEGSDNDTVPGKYFRLAWESYLTNFYIKSTRDVILRIKKEYPFIILRKYGSHYINLMTDGHMIVKYSTKYETFISTCERDNFFKDAFSMDPAHLKFSSLVMRIPRSLNRTQVVKSVVSIQNIKGSAHVITNNFDITQFKYILGSNTAALVNVENQPDIMGNYFTSVYNFSNLRDDYYKLAYINDEGPEYECPDIIKLLFTIYAPISLNDENFLCLNNIVPNWSVHLKNLTKLEKPSFYLSNVRDFEKASSLYAFKPTMYRNLCKKKSDEVIKVMDMPYSFAKDGLDIRILSEAKLENLFNLDYKNKLTFTGEEIFKNHFRLYCGYGDIGGFTNEDGVIIDSNFVEKSNLRKLQSFTLNVRFLTPQGVKLKNTNYKYYNIDLVTQDNYIIFGMLLADAELKLPNIRTVRVCESVINNSYRYLIYCTETSLQCKNVTSMYCNKNNIVTINYSYMVKLGVGTKIANVHGQKGIVSRVCDLSPYKYWTKDGQCVHPQVLFSQISIIGRTTSSQLYEMLASDEVAFNASGSIITPIGFNIHHIDAASKCVLTNAKNDLMTSENGFVANELPYSAICLEKQHRFNDTRKFSHIIAQLFATGGNMITTPEFDDEIFNEIVDE